MLVDIKRSWAGPGGWCGRVVLSLALSDTHLHSGCARRTGFSSRGTNPQTLSFPVPDLISLSRFGGDGGAAAAADGRRRRIQSADQGRVLSISILFLQPAAERPTERREIDPEPTSIRARRRPLDVISAALSIPGCFALVETVPCNFKSLDHYLCRLDVYLHVYLVKRNLQNSAKTFQTEGNLCLDFVGQLFISENWILLSEA